MRPAQLRIDVRDGIPMNHDKSVNVLPPTRLALPATRNPLQCLVIVRYFGVTAARPHVQRARSRTAVRQAAHAGDVTSMSE
jgi:hypothetical protein